MEIQRGDDTRHEPRVIAACGQDGAHSPCWRIEGEASADSVAPRFTIAMEHGDATPDPDRRIETRCEPRVPAVPRRP